MLPPPRVWVPHSLIPFLVLAALAVLFDRTDLDFRLTDPFYDFATKRWPYRSSWWADTVLHEGGKRLVGLITAGALGVFVGGWFLPRWGPFRRAALFFVLAVLASTGLVALGKRTLNRHCPWDYTRYGGQVTHTRLFEPAPAGAKPGHCFPAGHASGAFAMMSGYFVFHERRRRLALACLVAGFGLGLLFAFGQLARGAHFPSHNVYTIAVCWFVPMGLYQLVFSASLWKTVTV